MKQNMQQSTYSRCLSKTFMHPDFMYYLQMKTAYAILPPDIFWRKTSFTHTNHSGSIVRKMRKVAYLHLYRYETKYHLHSLMLKLGYNLIQGLRSDRPALKRCTHIKADMTLNAVIGNENVETEFKKLSDKRGIDLLYDSSTHELTIKIRYEAFKVPKLISTIEDENMKRSLDYRNERICEDARNTILVGMTLDYNDYEFEIVEVNEDYVIAYCNETNERIELNDLSFVMNACTTKLE